MYEDFLKKRDQDRRSAFIVTAVVLGTALISAVIESHCGEPTCVKWRRECEASQLFSSQECAQQAFLRFNCAGTP